MLNWDDYRIILAISRSAGLKGAANALSVTHSTVYRRLESIEGSLGIRIFERRKGDYHATEPGRTLIDAAERMEAAAVTADRQVAGRDQQLTGTVRITATELFATCFLARHLAAFHHAYPGLRVEVHADNRRLSLAKREADLTIRVSRPDEPTLFGRIIGKMKWGLYASEKTAADQRMSESFDSENFVGWDGVPLSAVVAQRLSAHFPDAQYIYRSTSLIANAAMAASGTAVAPLPCLLGETWPGLVALEKPLPGLGAEIWLLTHEDLQHNARVRALMDFLIAASAQDKALIGGMT